MRVAILTQGVGAGGVESVVRTLAHGLAQEADVVVHALELSHQYEPDGSHDRLTFGSGAIVRLNADGRTNLLQQLRHWKRLTEGFRPTHILAVKTLPMIFAPYFSPPARLVGWEHLAGAWPQGGNLAGQSRRVARRLSFGRYHGMVALTSAAYSDLARACPRANLLLAQNPVSAEFYGGPLGHRTDRVVVVGRLVPGKGLEDALMAWAMIEHGFPGWRLVFVGAGPLLDHLREMTRHLGIHGVVDFVGQRGDVADILCKSRILLHPSHFEVQPTTVREAAASGCALVVANCCEFIDRLPTEMCLRFEPGDVSVMAEYLARAMNSADVCAKLGQAASEMAKSWAPDKVSLEWLRWLRDV